MVKYVFRAEEKSYIFMRTREEQEYAAHPLPKQGC
jgi:hypothetical protein